MCSGMLSTQMSSPHSLYLPFISLFYLTNLYKYNLLIYLTVKTVFKRPCSLFATSNLTHMPPASLCSPCATPVAKTEPEAAIEPSKGYYGGEGLFSHRPEPWREPLGPPSPGDTPRTSCIKRNLFHVTEIPIEDFLGELQHSTAGSNNRSGYRGVRQVSLLNGLVISKTHWHPGK